MAFVLAVADVLFVVVFVVFVGFDGLVVVVVVTGAVDEGGVLEGEVGVVGVVAPAGGVVVVLITGWYVPVFAS